mgnify:CR=1 FL=1
MQEILVILSKQSPYWIDYSFWPLIDFYLFVFLYCLSLMHDHFYCLDPAVYLLLAFGYFSFGVIPNCLVDNVAVQAARYCGRRSIRSFKINHHAAGKIDKKDIKGYTCQILIFSQHFNGRWIIFRWAFALKPANNTQAITGFSSIVLLKVCERLSAPG